jgi:peptidoglycan/LPS O-acetylase OafA/YrhL
MAEARERLEGLDFLRGLASLAVCWFHLTRFHYNSPDQRGFAVVRQTGDYGWLGVEVFFVISGFVIPYSLYRARYRIRDFFTYLARRIVRLDPPYLAAIAVILVLAYVSGLKSGRPVVIEVYPVGWARVLLHLGYLNIFTSDTRYAWLNPSFWTLAIEMQFYLLMGLVFPLVVARRPAVRLAAIGVMAASSVLSVPTLFPTEQPWAPFIPGLLCLFLLGILTFQFRVGLIRVAEYLPALFVVGVTSVVTLGYAPTFTGLGAVAVILAYPARRSVISGFFAKISYSLYLLHWPIGHYTLSVVGMKYLRAESDAARISVLLLSLAVCLVSAYLLYILVERPAQRWSKRFRYSTDTSERQREPRADLSERAQRSEPRERSEPAQRRARERVGESEGRSPSAER